MSANLQMMAYLLSAVLFIFSLGGLSRQETSRKGNVYGIVGMAIAIGATLFHPDVTSWTLAAGGCHGFHTHRANQPCDAGGWC